MDVEAHQNLHDEQMSECRSFGSNIHPSGQSRKISIGVMADSKANARSGAMKGDGAIMENTERVISNVANFIGEKSNVEGVTASFHIKETGGPEVVKRSWISKSFYQRTPTSGTILQANQASNLLVSPGGRDKGIDCAPAKNSIQLFSNQTSVFASSNYNQNNFDGDTSERKGGKDGATERIEEFTFITAQEVIESDKTKPEDKINRTENRTENLRMKLCQILGANSPRTQRSGSSTRNIDEESLQLEQHLNQTDNKFVKTRQNSDSIETDSENPDPTRKRPLTRSWSRKKASVKKQPAKGKSGPSAKTTEHRREKSIFSSEEKWTGRRDAFLNDASSMSLRKKGQRKSSRIGPRKIRFPENDTTDKLYQDTSKTDLPQRNGATFSFGNKMGGFIDCLPDHQTKCPQTQKINEEKFSYRSSTVNHTDQKKGQGKSSRIGPHKTCFPENDAADEPYQDTSKTDPPLHDGATFSHGNKMGGFIGCLPDHQTKCPPTQRINQEREFCQSPTVNNTDQHGDLEGSENGNQQEDRSNPVVQNVAKSQDNFRSPTFQLKTPLSSSHISTPRTDQKAKDVNSPASTERRFSLGTIRNFKTFQTLEPDSNKLREPRQSSDTEGLNYYIPRKAASSVKEKQEQDGLSNLSSEERNFKGSQKGSRVRCTAKKKSLMLHPIKRLHRHEGIKFNDCSPASPSSKGTGENDWIHEVSEQNQDGFVRAVELFALELGKLKSKLKSVTSQKSAEILKSVAEEIHLQLQNVHSLIQTDIGKLTNLSKSKRKRQETRFEDQQKQLRLIYDRFKEDVNLHLQDCRNTVEVLEADQIEIKGVLEKKRAAHRKLLSQVEEAVEIQLNDAQRKITATQEMAREKLLQLKHVIAMCLKEGILD